MKIVMCFSQDIEQYQQTVLAQALQIKMTQAINNLRDAADIGGTGMLDRVMRTLLSEYCPKELREALRNIGQDAHFKKVATAYKLELSRARKADINLVAVEYLFDATGGEVQYSQNGTVLDHEKISKGIFIDSFLNPKRIQAEIDGIMSSAKVNPSGLSAEAMRHIKENRSALSLASAYKETIDMLFQGIQYLLNITSEDGRRILPDFFSELFILEKFTLALPERIARRFIKRFMETRKHETFWSPRVRDAFLNSVGEFVLVCMGVISPDMFKLQTGRLDTEILEAMRDKDFDVQAYLKRLSLTPSGTFFWNRWHTLNRPPSRITDDLIRDFITRTVRADAKAIFKVVSFETLFESLKQIARNSELDLEEKETACAEIMVDSFTNPEFIAVLQERLKTSWLSHLDIFYEKTILTHE